MAKVICIMGESGSGKTTSCRNLNPEATYYIDSDKKGLSWKGWRKQYNLENKNYFCCDEPEKVKAVLFGISEKLTNIKTVIIDTVGSMMVADEMRRSKEKGYDKWLDLATCIWELIDMAYTLRNDLTVVFIAHTQTERDESGYLFTRIKTSGKKLDKICLESKFTTVLNAKCIDGEYVFETHGKNTSTAKTPFGLFDTDTIPNDIVTVINALEEYEN